MIKTDLFEPNNTWEPILHHRDVHRTLIMFMFMYLYYFLIKKKHDDRQNVNIINVKCIKNQYMACIIVDFVN